MDFSVIFNFDRIKNDFLEVLKDITKFDGTLDRMKFLTYAIVMIIVLNIVGHVLGLFGGILGWTLRLAFPIISSCVCICPGARRLREAGFNPIIAFLYIIPCINIVPFVMCCLPASHKAITAPEAAPTDSAVPPQSAENRDDSAPLG